MDEAMMAWAKKNGLEDLYKQYLEECDEIAEQCEEEGYPSHGSNYDLRIESLQKSYPELFAEQEEELEREEDLKDTELEMCRDVLNRTAYINDDGDLLDKDMDLVRDDFGGECNIYDIDMVCLDIHDSSIQKEIQEILSQFPSAESVELEAKMRAEAEQKQSLTNEEAGSRDCPTLADVMRENVDLDACVDAVIQAEYINADGYLLDENMHPVLSENGDPFNINDFDMQQAAAQNPLIQKTIDRIPAAPEREVQTLADAMKQAQEQDSRQQDLGHEEQEMGKSDPTKNDIEF